MHLLYVRVASAFRRSKAFALLTFTLAFCPLYTRAASGDENWDDRFALPGVNGAVYALTTIGSDVYVGGVFTQCGGSNINYVARWNGRSWSPLGGGISNLISYNESVLALAPGGNSLYVGGTFRTVATNINSSLIAKWDGNGWSGLGTGITDPDINAMVNAIAVVGSNVYAGGTFNASGAMVATNIARWNGATWSSMNGGVGGTVYSFAVIGNDLYVGGSFAVPAAGPANIARWDGNSWSAVGGGVNGPVLSIAAVGNDLYVRGTFTLAGGSVATDGFARWNGSAWSAPHSGVVTNLQNYIGADSEHVYLAGVKPGPGPAQSRLAKYDGANWFIVGTDGDFGGFANFYAFTECDGQVYMGADSSVNPTNIVANNIIRLDGNRWEALGQGLDFAANALFINGSDVYAAGALGRAGGRSANFVARWDGARWWPLGSGLGSAATAVAVVGNYVYACGGFLTAGGSPANRIARWDGTNWSALGTGIPLGTPRALAVIGTNLYVGGNFTSAGGVNATNIARWDGTAWSAVGPGIIGGQVNSLTTDGTNLYAGGTFGKAGLVNTACVAKWDGANWSGYGTDFVATTVNSVRVSGTNVYVGGGLIIIADPNVSGVARWNGSTWVGLGSGTAGTVLSMAVRGSEVWASGQFTSASGVPANRIAKWNGSNWVALGSGLGTSSTSYATAMAFLGNDLYTSGGMETAGGKRSRFIGIWHEPRPIANASVLPNGSVVISWTSDTNQTFQVLSSASLTEPFAVLSGVISSAGTTTRYTNAAPGANARFYLIQQVFP